MLYAYRYIHLQKILVEDDLVDYLGILTLKTPNVKHHSLDSLRISNQETFDNTAYQRSNIMPHQIKRSQVPYEVLNQ